MAGATSLHLLGIFVLSAHTRPAARPISGILPRTTSDLRKLCNCSLDAPGRVVLFGFPRRSALPFVGLDICYHFCAICVTWLTRLLHSAVVPDVDCRRQRSIRKFAEYAASRVVPPRIRRAMGGSSSRRSRIYFPCHAPCAYRIPCLENYE